MSSNSSTGRRSDILRVRTIPTETKLRLALATAGRCQFAGCNRFLFRHHVTGLAGNFAQIAHIVAFSPRGPRGRAGIRPGLINDFRNLMLLCPTCHKLVDADAIRFDIPTLRRFKATHERRVAVLTGATPDNLTTVVKLTAVIRGQAVEIPDYDIDSALFPRYTDRSGDCVIDLTQMDDKSQGYYPQAKPIVRQQVAALYRQGLDGHTAQHLSVFALAPMPLLTFLGSQLSSKVPTDLFQRHRREESWRWEHGPATVHFAVDRARKAARRDRVAVVLSLSGTIRLGELPAPIRSSHTIWTLTPRARTPNPGLLRRRADLDAFSHAYRGLLASISREHGTTPVIDLFPAIPAPAAVACGRERLPGVQPTLRIYENDRRKGGFYVATEVN